MILEVNRSKAAILIGDGGCGWGGCARGADGSRGRRGRAAQRGGRRAAKTASGGFALLGRFLNRLTDYMIPVGGAFCALGLLYGGFLLMTGDARAGRVLGFVALGVAVVLLSKPIAA